MTLGYSHRSLLSAQLLCLSRVTVYECVRVVVSYIVVLARGVDNTGPVQKSIAV